MKTNEFVERLAATVKGHVVRELDKFDSRLKVAEKIIEDDSGIRRAMVEMVEARSPLALVNDMVDEISYGLGGLVDLQAIPGTGLMELANSLHNLEKTMRAPIVEVLDDNGNTIGAARRA